MAVVGNTYLTLADTYRAEAHLRNSANIIELLAQYNPVLTDGTVVECNQGEQHLTSARTGLPTPTWRKLYKGVQPTKGTLAQVKDQTGMAEDWSESDAKLVDKQKNPTRFRMVDAQAHLQGMSNAIATYTWYGDQDTQPEAFTGLAPRFSDLSAGTGSQIVDAGGTGSDNASIWFVTWGEDHCHYLYPEGSVAGLKRDDKGKTTKELGDGGLYDVYREKFTWDVGMSVRDYRGIARIANIDVSDLLANPADGGAYLSDLMIDAYYAMQNPGQSTGRTICYANRDIMKFLHKQAKNEKNVDLTLDMHEGRPVTNFMGMIPIHRDDNLLTTEQRVT